MNLPTDSAALLARAVKTWPEMRYLADARIGMGLAFDSVSGVMTPKVTIVVEVKGDYP